MGVRTSAGVGLLGAIPDCRDSAAALQRGGGDGTRAIPTGRTQFRSLPVVPFGGGQAAATPGPLAVGLRTPLGHPLAPRDPTRASVGHLCCLRPPRGMHPVCLLLPCTAFSQYVVLLYLLPICCSLIAFSCGGPLVDIASLSLVFSCLSPFLWFPHFSESFTFSTVFAL